MSSSTPSDWWAWLTARIAPILPPVWVWWIVGALCAVVATWLFGRASLRLIGKAGRAALPYLAARSVEDVLTIVAASIATGVSAQGMWRFSGDVLGLDGPLRLLLFAFIEVAIVTSAVRARRNMRENFSAGIDGIAVWALTVLTAVLSSMDARSLAEAVFRLAAPLVAAWLWERGMAIERHRIRGTGRIAWRFTPDRVMVRLGLAEARDRTAAEVDAHRRITRVSKAAKRLRVLQEAGVEGRKLNRAQAAFDKAMDALMEYTDLIGDEALQMRLLDQAATWAGATTLTKVQPRPVWQTLDHPANTPAGGMPEGADEISANLAEWAELKLRGRELVAAGDHSDDQDATTPATTRALVIPAPRTRLVIDPGDARPVGHLVPFELWSRPQPRPLSEGLLPPLMVADSDADPVAEQESVATDSRPVADRERPNEQDRRRTVRYYTGRVRKLNPPSKRELADWSGFSETWALSCMQEGRRLLTAQGWIFDERGTPTPPPDVVATAVSANGSEATDGGAE
ncbi:hypothetical protein [Nonomuraea sp. NPDC003804]|uniref:hypothetical protein n=1 Tax=Nonomuraea sp. NPDC003804 TaxID=3154547 RepID=UPI0033B514CB